MSDKLLPFHERCDQTARMHSQRRMHGSCVARDGDAVLVVGPSGSGKSDLALRLLSRGFELVADDQVDIVDGVASCPAELAGLLEVRGIGIVRLPWRPQARLALMVDLQGRAERLPQPRLDPEFGLPVVCIDAAAASAVDKVVVALDCALGRVGQVAGAFVA
jgi:HPr kinase/phosphorylase